MRTGVAKKTEGRPCEGRRFEEDRLGGAIVTNLYRAPTRKSQAEGMLSAEEESALIRLSRAGDRRAKHKLIAAFQPLVGRIAKKYLKHSNGRRGDLIQEGNVGLLNALERFDLGRGLRFSTYAAWWVRSAIHDFALAQRSIVRIKKSDIAIGRADVSLTIYGGDGQEDIPWADDAEMEDSRVDAISLALSRLTPRERQIFIARHLTDDAATLDQLGKEHGISRERVRQVAEVAFQKVSETVRLSAERRRVAAEISADWRRDLHDLKHGQGAAKWASRSASFERRLTQWRESHDG